MTNLLLSFAVLLLIAVLLSSLANRTVLSTAVLFLLGGFLLGDGVLDVVPLRPDDGIVETLAELALFAVLFTDGMHAGWRDLRSAWRLPGRALGWGLPLTLLITAVLAHYVVGLGWIESLLIAAVLTPTDPVFAAALVGNDKVPPRLRHLLNVESGVNDGLVLPFVLIFLAVAEGADDLHLGALASELLVGIVIGVAVPWAALKLESTRWFAVSPKYAPLNAVAIGLLVLALGQATHGNLFLAAFAAGVTVATVGEEFREAFDEFGELVAELLKLAALLVFGALLSPTFFGDVGWTGWVFAVLALIVARPAAIWVSFLGSRLTAREQGAVMWFGPKGFASVVYGLIVLESQIADADEIFHLVAVTIVLSIIAHSSTDIVVARGFDDEREVPAWFRKDERDRDGRGADEPDEDGAEESPGTRGERPG
ncbi:cation:proton antiporter [Actinomadura algeriensis]|uniref:NhaP-type Na+/H+ or K+/H+ antiporter n=1 Tax=Actinomadura algeriensis TaxID=1679523 RepID=A0ABR9JJY9_9ACTN|nr:cation:proton antiporter [Actinomadura algeriensis]MBE1530701.1 NhaP-type Na+/H+ or K+/H+ antiporter [Actinomadura algeriensis]